MRLFPLKQAGALAFAAAGLAFAIWLSIFFNDDKRPLTPQEKADRFAAENYLAGSLGASSPPSPANWEQRLVLLDPVTGLRHPLARESSALLIAATAGSPRIAAILAFAVAAAALAWLILDLGLARWTLGTPMIAMALLAIAHGQDWQFVDPTAFLTLFGGAFALGAWLRFRTSRGGREACLFGMALGFLMLTDFTLFIIFCAVSAVEALIKGRRTEMAPSPCAQSGHWKKVMLIVSLILALLGLRNHAVTGNALRSPKTEYLERYTTAPQWFWQPIRDPQAKVDHVIERYDELIALPQSRWPSPAYRVWIQRLREGVSYMGGLGLVLIALGCFLLRPKQETAAASLLCGGILAAVFLRYPLPLEWWSFAAPPLLLLASCGLENCTRWNRRAATRILATGALVQVATLPEAAKHRPSASEYAFLSQKTQTETTIRKTPGRHLIFVQNDIGTDAVVEPADLPRNWHDSELLFARELDDPNSEALIAAMPDRKPWRIVVYRERIGLQPWVRAKTDGAEKPRETSPEPASATETPTTK